MYTTWYTNIFPENRYTYSKMQLDAIPLCNALFCEVNPIPVKAAMNMMGKEVGPLRAPLTEIEDGHREVLRKAMADFGLL